MHDLDLFVRVCWASGNQPVSWQPTFAPVTLAKCEATRWLMAELPLLLSQTGDEDKNTTYPCHISPFSWTFGRVEWTVFWTWSIVMVLHRKLQTIQLQTIHWLSLLNRKSKKYFIRIETLTGNSRLVNMLYLSQQQKKMLFTSGNPGTIRPPNWSDLFFQSWLPQGLC